MWIGRKYPIASNTGQRTVLGFNVWDRRMKSDFFFSTVTSNENAYSASKNMENLKDKI